MYEQAASNWAVGLYSLFDPTNFLPFVPHLWNKQVIVSRYPNDTKIRDTDLLVGYLILFWVTLYLLYEKCLNSLFRRMRFPLVQRNRIIMAVWNCGFCFGSICYMMSSANQILSIVPQEQGMTYQELGITLHKSFYFHQAGIDILCHGAWIKGCTNLLFASFILNPYRQKVLLCIFQSAGRPVCKVLFLLHCQIWIYLYLYYVPTFMLWSEEDKYARTDLGLWLWFMTECLDSIWLKIFKHAKATHWLEICLFLPPTQEAIELAGIHKRHRESLRKFNNKTAKKAELWQTLVCAMAIKKKIKRIRQAKNNNTDLVMEDSEGEMDLLQANVKNEIVEEE